MVNFAQFYGTCVHFWNYFVTLYFQKQILQMNLVHSISTGKATGCNGVENGYLIKLSSKLSIKLFLQFTENCINLLHMHAFMKSALSWMTATHANQLICNIWISFYRYINLTLQIKWALCNSMWLAKCYQLKGLE